MSVLVLGTAQWGSDYGITNGRGRPNDAELVQLVEVAMASGVSRLDTAPRYGDAQARLRPWAKDFLITSKVSGGHRPAVSKEIECTLETLGIARIESLLVHDWESLSYEIRCQTVEALMAIKDRGLVSRVGVSVYEESGVVSAAEFFDHLDIVQVPSNALDQRLLKSQVIRDLHGKGTVFQVRSAFLQGLLASRSTNPQGQHPSVIGYHHRNEGQQLERALGHVQAIPWADQVVVGVPSARELSGVLQAWNSCDMALEPSEVACYEPSVIDPRNWMNDSKSENRI